MFQKIIPIAKFNKSLNQYLPYNLNHDNIYQSIGLIKHIEKRHPECVTYLNYLPSIISNPDYIGVNPNEAGTSFELIKRFDKNVQIGIKLDVKDDYLYVATLHTITEAKLIHNLNNGRIKKI